MACQLICFETDNAVVGNYKPDVTLTKRVAAFGARILVHLSQGSLCGALAWLVRDKEEPGEPPAALTIGHAMNAAVTL